MAGAGPTAAPPPTPFFPPARKPTAQPVWARSKAARTRVIKVSRIGHPPIGKAVNTARRECNRKVQEKCRCGTCTWLSYSFHEASKRTLTVVANAPNNQPEGLEDL